MEKEEKLLSVLLVIDKDKFVKEFRQFLVLWNRLEHVELVMENERKSLRSVHTVMRRVRFEKRLRRPSIFPRELRMV